MTMFNSQKINTDPAPFSGGRNQRISREEYLGIDPVMRKCVWLLDPRPEYDNNPNPVLVAFRDYAALETFGTVSEATIDRWIDAFASYDEFGGYDLWDHPKNTFHAFTVAEPEHIDHARKVIARLAALL